MQEHGREFGLALHPQLDQSALPGYRSMCPPILPLLQACQVFLLPFVEFLSSFAFSAVSDFSEHEKTRQEVEIESE